jgi:hypothetical protein
MFVKLTYWNNNATDGNVWEVLRTDGETFYVRNVGDWGGLEHRNVSADSVERIDDETAARLIADAESVRAASIIDRGTATERATVADAGCWVDGHWGWRGIARVVEIARDFGFTLTDDETDDLAAYDADDDAPYTPDTWATVHDTVSALADDAEQWLTDNVAPDGYCFGWDDGEFFLSPTELTAATLKLQAAEFRPLWWSIYRDDQRDAWEQGDDVHMGDLVDTDEPRSVRIDPDASPDFWEVPSCVWGDYCGDSVGRSNHRALIRDYPEFFSDHVGGYDSHSLLIPSRPDWDGDALSSLVDDLTRLRDEYPLYDEADHSALETDTAWEAWEQYLGADIRLALMREHHIDDDALDAIADETLRERFYGAYRDASEYPYMESATDVVFPGCDDIVAEIAEEIRSGTFGQTAETTSDAPTLFDAVTGDDTRATTYSLRSIAISAEGTDNA